VSAQQIMQTETSEPVIAPPGGDRELASLRRRVAELEAEVSRLRGERSGELARLQDRLYWLERLEIEPEMLIRRGWIRWPLLLRVRLRHLRRRRAR
jgi:hypothetical protein